MELVNVSLPVAMDADARRYCEQLEEGNILKIDNAPFVPSPDDCAFLRARKQTDSSLHKNIAYKPNLDRTTGGDGLDNTDAERMNRILGDFSKGALAFLSEVLQPYSASWKVDYASFRPVEEEGRELPLRHRNDLMHVDAFPTRPTQGGRILRMFTNIHPEKERTWKIAGPFPKLAEKYARDAGLSQVTSAVASARRAATSAVRAIGVKVPDRSPYDEFMLGFHHWLKSNESFQSTPESQIVVFQPWTTWITFTDSVAHAVMSGQYAVEQTCIVPFDAMLLPDLSPVAVLEKMAGRPLIAHRAVERSAA